MLSTLTRTVSLSTRYNYSKQSLFIQPIRSFNSIIQQQKQLCKFKINYISIRKCTTTTTITPSNSPKPEDEDKKKRINHNIWTIPNILSGFRMATTPYLAYIFVDSQFRNATALFFFLSFTDWLDGAIAKRFPGQRSVLGSYLDPMADKVLLNSMIAALYLQNLIPGWLAGLIFFRDIGLVAGTVAHRISTMSGTTFANFFKMSEVQFSVEPSFIGKLNTALMMGMIGGTIVIKAIYLNAEIDQTIQMGLTYLQYCVGVTTFSSGVGYILSHRHTFRQIGAGRDKIK
eukprot:c18251_g1_i1.p1 GENE.c18251_g1_i1~~c18251_g1_i1.p1  ORF type:complete len:287 (-),score=81.52 c18251_g1_i1:9-869(-)